MVVLIIGLLVTLIILCYKFYKLKKSIDVNQDLNQIKEIKL